MPIQNAIDALQTICGKIIEQGSMAPHERYPDRFFTFWNNSTAASKHYDNAPHSFAWTVDFNFYSTDHADVYATIAAAIDLLRANGWQIAEKGHAVASDHKTHTGRGFTAVYLET